MEVMPERRPQMMTMSECAAYLHVHETTIRRLLKRRAIPGFRLGTRVWRFDKDAIDAWRLGQKLASGGRGQ
jgi:excisionase family DNA binding protein